MKTMQELYTSAEVARFLKTTPGNVRVMVHRKQLRAKKVGSRLLFTKCEIERFLNGCPDRGR